MAKEKSSTSTTGKETQRPEVCHRQQFKHAPLDKESRQIRVLEILPKLTPDGLVQCRQRTIKLNDSDDEVGRFKALSYEWGSPDSTLQTIVINHGTLLVRSNLHDFLWAFRKKHSIRKSRLPLWIDAVCIDQENVSERNHQVTLMRDIYSKADEVVVVWLGTENSQFHYRTLVAARVAARLNEASGADLQVLDTARSYNIGSGLSSDAGAMTRALWSNAVNRLIKMMPRIVPKKPESFHSRGLTYLERAWIWQEILLAKKVRVFFGSAWLNWETMLFLLDFDRFNGTRSSYDEYKLKPPISLDLALGYFVSKSCKIKHDKVYAILGIVDGGETFPVRYDSTLLDLMVETSLFCIRQQFRVGFSPQTRGPVESAVTNLVYAWGLYSQLPTSNVTQIIDSRKLQLQSHYSDDCYARGLSRIRDVGSDILTSMKEAVPCNPQLRLWLRNLTEQMSCTHCIVDRCGPPAAYPYTASVILLRKENTTWEESRYNIVGQLRVLNDGPTVHVFAESYDNPGLPKATVIEKIDIENWKTNTELKCLDIRSAVILMGLPYNQKVRKAAMGLLYGLEFFPIPRVTYFSARASETSEDGKPNVFEEESHFPASFTWEPPRSEIEIAYSPILRRTPMFATLEQHSLPRPAFI